MIFFFFLHWSDRWSEWFPHQSFVVDHTMSGQSFHQVYVQKMLTGQTTNMCFFSPPPAWVSVFWFQIEEVTFVRERHLLSRKWNALYLFCPITLGTFVMCYRSYGTRENCHSVFLYTEIFLIFKIILWGKKSFFIATHFQ